MIESSSNGGWKDIPVGLGGDHDHQDDDGDDQHIKDRTRTRTHKKIKTTNHYDNVQLGKQATVDLPAQPGEEIGMMYGGSIQVLRGDQYQVIHDNSNGSGQSQKRIVLLVPTPEGKEGGEEEKKKKVKNPKTDSVVVEQPQEHGEELPRIDDVNNSTIPLKTKKKKKKEPQTTASPTPTLTETQKEQGSVPTKKSKKRPAPLESDVPQSAHKHSPSSTASLSHDEVDDDWLKVQQSWSHACGGALLDPILCRALSRLGFVQPTPIQAATLSASILGRRNLVGAAPTGSGKTLAFLLPILQSLLQERQEQQEYILPPPKIPVPRALIVTPTRELATQIYNECEKLLPRQCVTLVGGIAPVKQARLLSTIRPPILVGTPGRLWQMVRFFRMIVW
jgi:ATP-dependent RNA helicase DDX24/MAK5